MKTQELTALSYFLKDLEVIKNIFENTSETFDNVSFTQIENDRYIHLTNPDTFKDTSIFTVEFTEDGHRIYREYKIKDYFWSDEPSIENDLDLVYMKKELKKEVK